MILIKHGVIGMGACVHEARAFVEIMEEWARFLTVAKIFGGTKHLVKPSDLQALGARYARAIKFGGRQVPPGAETS
jgi:ribulose-5-phosphate 4-epimerase/fuculose-1-phosphate aldolase